MQLFLKNRNKYILTFKAWVSQEFVWMISTTYSSTNPIFQSSTWLDWPAGSILRAFINVHPSKTPWTNPMEIGRINSSNLMSLFLSRLLRARCDWWAPARGRRRVGAGLAAPAGAPSGAPAISRTFCKGLWRRRWRMDTEALSAGLHGDAASMPRVQLWVRNTIILD